MTVVFLTLAMLAQGGRGGYIAVNEYKHWQHLCKGNAKWFKKVQQPSSVDKLLIFPHFPPFSLIFPHFPSFSLIFPISPIYPIFPWPAGYWDTPDMDTSQS